MCFRKPFLLDFADICWLFFWPSVVCFRGPFFRFLPSFESMNNGEHAHRGVSFWAMVDRSTRNLIRALEKNCYMDNDLLGEPIHDVEHVSFVELPHTLSDNIT